MANTKSDWERLKYFVNKIQKIAEKPTISEKEKVLLVASAKKSLELLKSIENKSSQKKTSNTEKTNSHKRLKLLIREKKKIAIAAIVVAVVIGAITAIANFPQKKEEELRFVKHPSHEALEAYLEEIVTYEFSGDSHWCGGEAKSVFFSPRAYKILSPLTLESFITEEEELELVDVRIDSSNRGGSQITKSWVFWMKKESGKWCILEITES